MKVIRDKIKDQNLKKKIRICIFSVILLVPVFVGTMHLLKNDHNQLNDKASETTATRNLKQGKEKQEKSEELETKNQKESKANAKGQKDENFSNDSQGSSDYNTAVIDNNENVGDHVGNTIVSSETQTNGEGGASEVNEKAPSPASQPTPEQTPAPPTCGYQDYGIGNSGQVFANSQDAKNWATSEIFNERSKWYGYRFSLSTVGCDSDGTPKSTVNFK